MLDADLVQTLSSVRPHTSVWISEALEVAVPEEIAARVTSEIQGHRSIVSAARTTFGCDMVGFSVHNMRLLDAPPGSAPQIPHADDEWNSELIGIVHVRDGQEATRALRYDGRVEYPAPVEEVCAVCNIERPLHDGIVRQRWHLSAAYEAGRWECRDGGYCCRVPHVPPDTTSAFPQLLDPEGCIGSMQPCGGMPSAG